MAFVWINRREQQWQSIKCMHTTGKGGKPVKKPKTILKKSDRFKVFFSLPHAHAKKVNADFCCISKIEKIILRARIIIKTCSRHGLSSLWNYYMPLIRRNSLETSFEEGNEFNLRKLPRRRKKNHFLTFIVTIKFFLLIWIWI